MKREYYVNTLDMKWSDFEYYIKMLAKNIRKSKIKISNIYGIPRGGLVIGIRLSHLLNKPLVTDWADRNPETLVVDDCVDSGATMKKIVEARYCTLTHWNTAVLLYCPNSSFRPTFFSGLKSKTTWVIFPWEHK